MCTPNWAEKGSNIRCKLKESVKYFVQMVKEGKETKRSGA
jgi:hypothetical protein